MSRNDKVNTCKNKAISSGYKLKADYGIMYVTYPDFDLFGSVGYAYFPYNA